MPSGLEARVKIDNELKDALSRLKIKSGGISEDIAEQLRKEGLDITGRKICRILVGGINSSDYRTVPYDFYVQVVGEEPNNTVLFRKEPRVAIDDKLKAALYRRRNGVMFKELAERLRSKGHRITEKTLSKILGADKTYSHYNAVPYDLYVELVGKEPKKIQWQEPIDLARKIAYWHCYFFNVTKKELATQIAEDAKHYGLEYSVISTGLILFYDKRKSSINPIITDIVANKFRNAAGMPQSSLDEIGGFVNYLDSINTGEKNLDKVTWDTAKPVIDDLQRLTSCGLVGLVGKGITRKRLESGEKKISVEKLYELKMRLQETPQYRLVGLLMRLKNVLASTRLNLTLAELQLVNKGKQNYGEEAFMEYIFPAYIAIKQQHTFPIKCFEMIANYPETINSKYKGSLDIIAATVGNELLSYKKKILDRNMREGFNLGVTKDGINTTLKDAMKDIHYYRKA